MSNNINWGFLERYIPKMELAVLRGNAKSEEKDFFIELLLDVEKQIKGMPGLYETYNLGPDKIQIGMHYFGGTTDFWLYELDQETGEGTAFVCLNGDSDCAERGPVYIPEIVGLRFMALDLYWNTDKTLQEVMARYA